jgi:hypothetical protein
LPNAAGKLAVLAQYQMLLDSESLKTIDKIVDLLLATAPVNA